MCYRVIWVRLVLNVIMRNAVHSQSLYGRINVEVKNVIYN